MSIQDAITYQLTRRTQRNSAGKLLCRRCSKPVPDAFSFVLQIPGDNTTVFGPCCSEECLCYLKVCSHCNKDYVVDHEEEISYQGEGVWLCKECLSHMETCADCGKIRPLVDSPSGKVCNSCFSANYFTCTKCNRVHANESKQTTNRPQYSHVVDVETKVCKTCFARAILGVTPLKLKECEACGNHYSYKRDMSHNFCPDCIRSKRVRKCEGCTKYMMRWESYSGKCFCDKCQQSIVQCSSCSQYDLPSQFKKIKGTIQNHYVCSKCSVGTECPVCYSLSTSVTNKGCSNCFNKTNFCDRCGEYHFGERNCRKAMFTTMDYGYKPIPLFNFINSKRVFFGFENEINYASQQDHDRAIRDIYGTYSSKQLYVKRDGSIDGSGFEVVSHPMTKEYFDKLDTAPMFIEPPKKTDTSCGLHVHLSKKSFDGKAHLYKYIEFIHDDRNKKFILSVAGRDFNGYSSKFTDKVSKTIKGTAMRERHRAVNLTNQKTYEVRIFKGARNNEELRYRIEFALALLEFTRNCSIMDITHDKFIKWVDKNNYPYLYTFLHA